MDQLKLCCLYKHEDLSLNLMNSVAINSVSLQHKRQADTGNSSGEDVDGLSSQSSEGTSIT